uniref:Putative secreted peptide n=1 Tax=Anopheles braziliensis TaxID=58242 RepID=A0A2M3ZXI6_9DIPT
MSMNARYETHVVVVFLSCPSLLTLAMGIKGRMAECSSSIRAKMNAFSMKVFHLFPKCVPWSERQLPLTIGMIPIP